jgi:hypothetical protein
VYIRSNTWGQNIFFVCINYTDLTIYRTERCQYQNKRGHYPAEEVPSTQQHLNTPWYTAHNTMLGPTHVQVYTVYDLQQKTQ